MNGLKNDMNGQAKRVAQRFALVASAGELATETGITGWETGTATASCITLFNEWLSNYGKGDIEDIKMLKRIKAFIDQYSNSRFESIVPDFEDSTYHSRINNRVGFKVASKDELIVYYYFFDNPFENEVCGSFEPKQVLKTLQKHDCLHKPEKGRYKTKTSTCVRKLGGESRMYAINVSKLSEFINDSDNEKASSHPNPVDDIDDYSEFLNM